MKLTVGISEMKTSRDLDDVIVTYSLGSCIGLALYDPAAQVGGIIHCMLPLSKLDPNRAQVMPAMFTDTGVPQLIAALLDIGANKQNLIATVAGAAKLLGSETTFNIGERNKVVLRKVLWKHKILIAKEETGGTKARTLFLHMNTGKTILRSGGKEYEL